MRRLVVVPGDFKLGPGDVAFTYVSLLSLVFLVPFAIVELYLGRITIALTELWIIAMILADFLGTRRNGVPALPRWIFMTSVVLIDFYLISDRGQIGLYWAYPIAICLHLALAPRTALVLNLLFLAGLAPLAAGAVGALEALRVLATLILTSTFAYLFSRTVSEHRAELEEQIVTDSLTGAYNRRYLDRRFAETVEQKNRYGHTASMILFDIDHFKRINDRHGHHVGDRVLRTVIETVKTRVRVVDQVFRYGGEEFVILLPDTGIRQAQKLAQDITSMIESLSMIEGGPVTISCGVAELEAEEAALTWIDRCDRALYSAKKRGRNRVCTTEDVVMDEAADYQAAAT